MGLVSGLYRSPLAFDGRKPSTLTSPPSLHWVVRLIFHLFLHLLLRLLVVLLLGGLDGLSRPALEGEGAFEHGNLAGPRMFDPTTSGEVEEP